MNAQASHATLRDPQTAQCVSALRLTNDSGLQAVALPGRALDLYSLRYLGIPVSYTDYSAMLEPSGFSPEDSASFSKRFFAGFNTTCGLIQSGRACTDGGRAFGCHGAISNTPAETAEIRRRVHETEIFGLVRERHPEGEHMLLTRRLRISDDSARIAICDEVTNCSDLPAPFMMMYHMNFGAPFLSEALQITADFDYIEERDSGLPASPRQALAMEPAGARTQETVYYTRPVFANGIRLYQPALDMTCILQVEGADMTWMGLWKSFLQGQYALGIEPCNCPGLGRTRARERGLLPMLAPGETRTHTITASFQRGVS